MKFVKTPRYQRITLEGRKAAAFRRRQARELARFPLFANEIAASQASIEDEEAKRNELAERSDQNQRDFTARVWKNARRRYFAADATTRAAIRGMWDSWAGPRTGLYFSYCVDYCNGDLERRTQAARAHALAIRREVRAKVGGQQALELEVA